MYDCTFLMARFRHTDFSQAPPYVDLKLGNDFLNLNEKVLEGRYVKLPSLYISLCFCKRPIDRGLVMLMTSKVCHQHQKDAIIIFGLQQLSTIAMNRFFMGIVMLVTNLCW